MISRFFCCECGQEGIPIFRKPSCKRERGHLKNLFCVHCGRETNHVEIKENDFEYTYEDFEKEFKLGRFINGKRTPINELQYCSNINCNRYVNGKCWDAANISNCKYKEG